MSNTTTTAGYPAYTEFLPIGRADGDDRGWDQRDFAVVGGAA